MIGIWQIIGNGKIVKNPVRQRVFRYLPVHKIGTGKEIRAALPGICAVLARRFPGGHAEPKKDMLRMTACTLTLPEKAF